MWQKIFLFHQHKGRAFGDRVMGIEDKRVKSKSRLSLLKLVKLVNKYREYVKFIYIVNYCTLHQGSY